MQAGKEGDVHLACISFFYSLLKLTQVGGELSRKIRFQMSLWQT